MRYANFGPVSDKLSRKDLIADFAAELRHQLSRQPLTSRVQQEFNALIRRADEATDANQNTITALRDDLINALNHFAPPYGYFGPHPARAGVWGYWMTTDSFERLQRLFEIRQRW